MENELIGKAAFFKSKYFSRMKYNTATTERASELAEIRLEETNRTCACSVFQHQNLCIYASCCHRLSLFSSFHISQSAVNTCVHPVFHCSYFRFFP